MNEKLPEKIKRWTAKRRAALVIQILKGETTVREAARQHGLKASEVQQWYDRFLDGAENNLRTKPRDEQAMLVQENKRLKQKVGELVLDMDILKEAVKPYRPFDLGTSEE